MRKLAIRILDRLKEPSTYAGLAGVAGAIGMSEPMYGAITAAVAGICGVAAMVLKERGQTDQAAS